MATARGLHNRVVLYRGRRVIVVNFGLFAAIGGAAAVFWALARQLQCDVFAGAPGAAMAVYPLVIALVVLGSRALSLLLDWRGMLRGPLAAVLKPGFAFQGGMIAGAIGMYVAARAAGLEPLSLMDTFALATPLGQAIGRIGCLTYGCCHGKATSSRFAIRYVNPESKAVWSSGIAGVAVLPVQVYSALVNFATFLVVNQVAAHGPWQAGQITGLYLVIDSLGRLGLEFLRGIPVTRIAGLTPFQIISATLCVLGALLFGHGGAAVDFSGWDRFASAAAAASHHTWGIAIVFLVFLAAYGVQGPKVGSYRAADAPPAIDRAPHASGSDLRAVR